MFEASVKARRVERGQTIEGTVVAIGPEVAFVDVGGKGEATIDIAELKDDEGRLDVSVGDRIHAVVVSTAGGLTLSRKLARGAATDRQLEDAFRTGLPVEGKVERAVKGGYEVRIGRARGFCPFSQIDIVRSEPPAHDGRVYEFRIIEYKDGGRNLVVSRRAPLEEQQQANAGGGRGGGRPRGGREGGGASGRGVGALRALAGAAQGPLAASWMVVARRRHDAGRPGGRRDHGEGPARGRGPPEDFARDETAHRRSVVESPRDLRRRPGACRPRHARRRVRRARRARAGRRGAGPRV